MKSNFSEFLFLQLLYHVSSTVFSAPHKLASLFKMEEQVLDLLHNSSLSYAKESISLYHNACQPRFKQIPRSRRKDQVLVIKSTIGLKQALQGVPHSETQVEFDWNLPDF